MGKQDKSTDLIKDAFKEKTWNEIHTTDSWRVFKILAELVEGFELSLIHISEPTRPY